MKLKTLNEEFERFLKAFKHYDKVLVGAGAGLSTAAGFTYSGPRFQKYFADFQRIYGFDEMYSGGFYPFPTKEEFFAYWSRYIYINRYMNPPKNVYKKLLQILQDKDYFVITTNVDHCFQKAGFDKERLFYTQGDYGLFQCAKGTSKECRQTTFDNHETILKMLESQGCQLDTEGDLIVPPNCRRTISKDLLPLCPFCGNPLTMNLRSDDSFVQDKGWFQAAQRYQNFLQNHLDEDILFLDLGTGRNTPAIIKYPFFKWTFQNPKSTYISINLGEAIAPQEIIDRSILLDADIALILNQISST